MSIPDPIVLLDARARYVHPAITVERASTRSIWLPNSGERATVPINAIGWDVDPATGETLGALIERERTNRFTRSNQLDHEDWVTGNIDVAADGSWWRVEANSTGSVHRSISQGGGSVTEDYHYAVSFDVRFDDVPGILAQFSNGFGASDNLRVYVDASGVRVATGDTDPSSLVSYEMRPLRGGGYRVAMCVRATSSDTATIRLLLKDSYGSAVTSTLSIGEGLWLRALQFEEVDGAQGNAPVASSYIETEGSTATRSADSLALLNVVDQPWFNPLMGTFVAEYLLPNPDVTAIRPVWKLGASNTSGTGIVLRNFNGSSSFATRTAGDSSSVSGSALRNGINRVATSFNIATGGAGMATNGQHSSGVVLSFSESDLQNLYIGQGGSFANNREYRRLQGWLYRLFYYPSEVSAATLQSLTAIQE